MAIEVTVEYQADGVSWHSQKGWVFTGFGGCNEGELDHLLACIEAIKKAREEQKNDLVR